jgi:hypothetical protein
MGACGGQVESGLLAVKDGSADAEAAADALAPTSGRDGTADSAVTADVFEPTDGATAADVGSAFDSFPESPVDETRDVFEPTDGATAADVGSAFDVFDESSADAASDAPSPTDGSGATDGGCSSACPGTTPVCLDGACVACIPATARCSDNGVQTCGTDGQWGGAAACAPHETCTSSGSTASCTCVASICAQEGTVCQGIQTLVTCAIDANNCAYVAATTTCTVPTMCLGGGPDAGCCALCPAVCLQGQTECVNGGVAACTLSTDCCWTYGAPVACGPHQECLYGKCPCLADPACPAVGSVCDGDSVVVCAADASGCIYAASLTVCSGTTPFCANGTCIPTLPSGSDAGSCVLPSCLTALGANCIPNGPCSQAENVVTGDTYSCYPNGVKQSDVFDPNGGDIVITVENSNGTCYLLHYDVNDINSEIPTTVTVTNGADAGFPTAVINMNVAADGVTWSVTCAGGEPVTLDPSCANAWPISLVEDPFPLDCTTTTTCSM